MRGSGLSLERFINGKTQRTKAEAKTKKRAIIHKAQRKREYAKVKQREGIVTQRGRNPTIAPAAAASDEDDASGGPLSFYDRFFRDLKRGNADPDSEEPERPRKKAAISDNGGKSAAAGVPAAGTGSRAVANATRKPTAKPDPFFKAKKKAEAVKLERQKEQEARQRQRAEVEKKVSSRKKRHVKLSQRTASGQPVVKNHITDILSRLQAERKAGAQ
ncbi:hypothetical protein PybrP1_008235 [[Pythium] brassicae (nom. inval.)]|nr:hypothetical protein PybrP1_008235 [[Pythium] brassicae (nom. inval.)]